MKKLILLFLLVAPAWGQEITLLDDAEYEERCAQFSPPDPACGVTIRPRSAPLDCSGTDFSPLHPFCNPRQTEQDFQRRCDGFSPAPPGCSRS